MKESYKEEYKKHKICWIHVHKVYVTKIHFVNFEIQTIDNIGDFKVAIEST